MERSVHPDQCNASSWYNKAEKALADAKKDNDFIYHERIPDYKNLKLIGKAAVAKATALPEKLGNSNKVLFDELCPLAVHQALAAFDTRKKEMVKRELERLTEATNLANVSMSSMNLPGLFTFCLYLQFEFLRQNHVFFIRLVKIEISAVCLLFCQLFVYNLNYSAKIILSSHQ